MAASRCADVACPLSSASSRSASDRAVAAAQRAFATWSQTTPRQRQAALLALARLIRAGVRDTFGVELANEPVLVGVSL